MRKLCSGPEHLLNNSLKSCRCLRRVNGGAGAVKTSHNDVSCAWTESTTDNESKPKGKSVSICYASCCMSSRLGTNTKKVARKRIETDKISSNQTNEGKT